MDFNLEVMIKIMITIMIMIMIMIMITIGTMHVCIQEATIPHSYLYVRFARKMN